MTWKKDIPWNEWSLQMCFYLELSVYIDTSQEGSRKKGIAKSFYQNWKAIWKSWKSSNQYFWEKQTHASDRVWVEDSYGKDGGGRRRAKRQEGVGLYPGHQCQSPVAVAMESSCILVDFLSQPWRFCALLKQCGGKCISLLLMAGRR